jgi:TolB protein
MRLSTSLSTLALALALASAPAVASPPAPAPSPARADPEQIDPDLDLAEDDLLGELVVEAKRRGELVLPKIAVLAPPDGNTSFLHELLARDLDLSGEFELVAVDRTMAFDDPFDAPAFVELGLEAVVTANLDRRSDGRFDLAVRVYLPAVGELAAWSKTITVSASDGRLVGHRLADSVIGALTGIDGPFASRLVLVRTEGNERHAYLVDPDGKGLTRLSADDQLVVTATLDRDAQPYWAASRKSGAYKLYRAGEPGPLPIDPGGSIYGIAFAPNDAGVALAVATDDRIQVFTGASLVDTLVARTKVEFALSPTFTADGRLVYSGARKDLRRIYVGTKPVSMPELSAASPTVCNHPDGPRLIYAVGNGKQTDLVASDLDGSRLSRLTWRGRNLAPACSPDGRLIAFFSTRKQDEGPGLYLMRTDGRRPKRVHAALGDVLVWARVPAKPRT